MTEMILRLHEGDVDVDGALSRLQTVGRIVVTETGGLKDLANLKSGDVLFILGHGDLQTIGDKTPAQLAKLLSDNDLKSGVKITLVACNSGSGNLPYALELKTELVSKKILPSSVSGGTDFMQVQNDGSLKVAGYDWTINQWLPDKVSGSSKVMTPWGISKKNAPSTFSTS